MKCLIIANNVGVSAPGIVNETLIRELSEYADISLISLQSRIGMNLKVTSLQTVPKKFNHWRIERIMFSLFGRNLFDDLWLLLQRKLLNYQIVEKYDFIISFISNHNYESLLLGELISKKYKKKWIVYSVDAIPAPLGWETDSRFYRNTKTFINKHLSRCDAFFSSNNQMLDYQLSSLNLSNIVTGVLFNPIRSEYKERIEFTNDKTIFLYTGSIYGPRKIETLLAGFRLYLQKEPTACLIFVGTSFSKYYDECKELIKSGNIEVHGFTQDLSSFYNAANVLIDVNAYFENDVFLSSKIINYLSIKKPIISITGINSPSRNIFCDDPSIIHCQHNAIEIYNALINANKIKSVDWTHRNKYVQLFTAKNIINKFINELTIGKVIE